MAVQPAAVASVAKAAQPHVVTAKYVFGEPLVGYAVNSPFGLRKMPWEEGGRLHEGVDIAAPSGAPVRATLAGVVVRSGIDGGYGRFIEVAHEDGLTSFYAHLGRVEALKAGTPIAAGAIVGYVGSSGRSTGSHLHFEIRLDGQPLNPTAFIGQTFLTRADLPLSVAARVPRQVRIAQVSNWPKSVLGKRGPVAVTVADANLPGGRVRAVIAPTDPTKPVPYRLAQYQRLQAMTARAQAEQGTRVAPAMPVIERMAPAAPATAPSHAPSADHDPMATR